MTVVTACRLEEVYGDMPVEGVQLAEMAAPAKAGKEAQKEEEAGRVAERQVVARGAHSRSAPQRAAGSQDLASWLHPMMCTLAVLLVLVILLLVYLISVHAQFTRELRWGMRMGVGGGGLRGAAWR